MKYIIHTCNKRIWYVEEFLIPSMKDQGLPEADILVHMDDNYRGCLFATLDSFLKCGRKKISAWHLQDDVAISRDFAEKTAKYDSGIVCGFWHRHTNEPDLKAETTGEDMRYSFPCIRIPWEVCRDFVEWFYGDASKRDEYQRWIGAKKFVDSFFRDYIRGKCPDIPVQNLIPSIVEHVDWLIGGSTINKWRSGICRADYWEDESIIEGLREQLALRQRGAF